MTKAELIELLTVERFAPPPQRRPQHVLVDAEAEQHLADLSEAVGGHLDVIDGEAS